MHHPLPTDPSWTSLSSSMPLLWNVLFPPFPQDPLSLSHLHRSPMLSTLRAHFPQLFLHKAFLQQAPRVQAGVIS